MRLIYAMRYSANVEAMTQFYREHLGFTTAAESQAFVEFATGPTSHALLAVSAGREPGFELCFAVDQIEAEVERLRARGAEFMDELRAEAFGKVIHMRDAEGVVSTLLQPAWPSAAKGAPELATVIVNAWDFGAAKTFYRDRLGLPVVHENAHWIELDTGGARIALHARAERPDIPGHGRQQVACAFDMDDLDAWHTAAMDRGTPVATEPTEESFGRYAEVVDPDGHLVVFREPVEALPNPASIAESFEDDTPHTGGFRKPVRKPSRSVSRAVHSARRPAPANASHAQRGAGIDEGVTVPSNGGGAHTATAKAAGISGHHKPKSNLRLRSVRGGGEERTREYPRNRFDVKRARAKPGIGRAEKEKQRMLSQQKTTTAQVSKSHPVKHAAARQAPGRGGRIVARTLQRAATRPVARAAARVTVRTTARAGAARASGRAGAARTTSARTTAARATARSTKRTAAPKRAAARTTRTRTAARSAARTRTSPARKSARKTRSSRSR